MSDLLSPLLVTMMDEAHAYVCFCALMQRLKKNFMVDGQAMTKMFQHLSEGKTAKGQLISKCPFGVFKSPKKPMKFFFQDFCPSL